ncbi:copper-binding protein [Rhizobium sp. CC1099]|uniref:copper-binding protein n=1 Tax=Rhizobium sp. CC1099 TaxID=3039160 RepID=UPI0024B0446E|nr:copper-binding protein [Rhizobium sp. CC1099]WFU88691.1 copper-binding protein [Rhizobium sp. CC1099]
MKTAMKLAVAALLSLSTASGAFAQEFTKGVVNKVDTKAKKVTIKHEDLKGLDMPAMTMVFRVEDPALLEKLKEGSNIEFVAERVNGKITVTEVK